MPAELQNPGSYRWDDVRVFLALARGGTLSAAGAALGVNASTVGRRIDAFEAALGVRLFDRMPDGVALTAAAEELVPAAEELERAALGIAGTVEGFETEPEGTVRITAPPGVADHFIAPGIGRLIARYPRLRIEIDASIGYADLTRREADIAVRATRPDAGDLIVKRLGGDADVLLASASYRDQLGTLRDVAAARWITWGRNLAHIPSGRWIATAVPDEAIALRTSSINGQLAAAEAGLGILVLPRLYAGFRTLVEVPLSRALRKKLPPLPVEEAWLVGHRALRNVPRIAAVWQFILEEMAVLADSAAR